MPEIIFFAPAQLEVPGHQAYYLEEVKLACIAFGIYPPIEVGSSRCDYTLPGPFGTLWSQK